MTFGTFVIGNKILDGIEYQRHTSSNMRKMEDHVTSTFLAFLKLIVRLDP